MTALLTAFAELSAIGGLDSGGVERQAATVADGRTRTWLTERLTARGFAVRTDRIGNLFGLCELVPGAPWVLAGSHLDSQPRGGRFDGAYGVLAAAEAADRVRRGLAGTPRYNLGVVDWFNEEGSRFTPSMMGSGVFVGHLGLDDALATVDDAGVSVADALDAIGARGSADVLRPGDLAAYAEIHIEQGRELESSGTTIGLVDRTWAARKYELVVHGAQAHTGATAIADRHDALYAAALIVVAARELADACTPDLHTACGRLTVLPNSPVVVPREVRLHLDLRSADDDLLAEADDALRRRLGEIEIRAGVRVEERVAHGWAGQHYDPAGVALGRGVADGLGLRTATVATRAGHDSTNLKDVTPTVMLFVPSIAGVSHAEDERTADDDLCAGVDVLAGTLARLLDGALG